MAELADIRQALADALALPGFQVSGYMLSNPTPPAIHVFPDEITYDAAMARGLDTWQLKIQAYVGFTTDIGAQKRLDALLAKTGTSSIKTLVESDRTLGNVVQDARVVDCTGYRLYGATGDGRVVLGAEWTVTVYA